MSYATAAGASSSSGGRKSSIQSAVMPSSSVAYGRRQWAKRTWRHHCNSEFYPQQSTLNLFQSPFPGVGASPERSRRSFSRLLSKRSANQECLGKEMGRQHARETRQSQRSAIAAEDVRSDEVSEALSLHRLTADTARKLHILSTTDAR